MVKLNGLSQLHLSYILSLRNHTELLWELNWCGESDVSCFGLVGRNEESKERWRSGVEGKSNSVQRGRGRAFVGFPLCNWTSMAGFVQVVHTFSGEGKWDGRRKSCRQGGTWNLGRLVSGKERRKQEEYAIEAFREGKGEHLGDVPLLLLHWDTLQQQFSLY